MGNDRPDKDANCIARQLKTKTCGVQGPFIYTKRDILKDEELTYDYGNYPYEWRLTRKAPGNENSEEAIKAIDSPPGKQAL